MIIWKNAQGRIAADYEYACARNGIACLLHVNICGFEHNFTERKMGSVGHGSQYTAGVGFVSAGPCALANRFGTMSTI